MIGTSAPQAAGLTGPGLTLARVKYGGGGDWYSNPTSLPNLAHAIEERTTLTVAQYSEARIAPGDDELFDYPMLYRNRSTAQIPDSGGIFIRR